MMAASAFVTSGLNPRAPIAPSALPELLVQCPAAPRVGLEGAAVIGTATVGAVLMGRRVAKVAGARRSRQSRQRSRVIVGDAKASFTATVLPEVDRSTTKKFRKELMRSDQYFKFNQRKMKGAMDELRKISGSDLLTKIRENGFRLTIGEGDNQVTFVLAESYGFCWGVERTLAMAYEARTHFPKENIWVTNEIIHNAVVNRDLAAVGMKFVPKASDGGKDFSEIEEGDVVILPAFGASVDEMSFLKDRNVQIVDTTCPWVSKVWGSVERSKDKGHTAILHGKWAHEETVATKSFAAKYVVVKDMVEAEFVARYMLGDENSPTREEFMTKFAKAISPTFDPDTDLECVGVANQTTMLKGETELIGKLLERVMIRKYGPQNVNDHFLSFNTICDATQERQDAIYDMFGATYEPPTSQLYADLEGEQLGMNLASDKDDGLDGMSGKELEAQTKGGAAASTSVPGTATGTKEDELEKVAAQVDLTLVVGGFNSSNTIHLIEIPEELGCPTYHIDCADRIGEGQPDDELDRNVIQHKPLLTLPAEAMMEKGLQITENFLPEGPITIGITAGASTPDSSVGECLARVLVLRGHEYWC